MSNTRSGLKRFESFSQFGDNLILRLSKHLDVATTRNLAVTDRRLTGLFAEDLDKTALFLQLVARGEQDQAEEMLKKDPDLLLKRRKLTDRAGRTFNDITGLQYAFWALDRHMWEMILRYMPLDAAVAQLKQHLDEKNPPDYVKEHGRHFDFQKIIEAYQSYCTAALPGQWRGTADRDLNKLLFAVGKAQRDLPAHAMQEFYRADRSFVVNGAAPTFNESALPRVITPVNAKQTVYPLQKDKGLGYLYILVRAASEAIEYFYKSEARGYETLSQDLNAVTSMKHVRQSEFSQMTMRLMTPTLDTGMKRPGPCEAA